MIIIKIFSLVLGVP